MTFLVYADSLVMLLNTGILKESCVRYTLQLHTWGDMEISPLTLKNQAVLEVSYPTLFSTPPSARQAEHRSIFSGYHLTAIGTSVPVVPNWSCIPPRQHYSWQVTLGQQYLRYCARTDSRMISWQDHLEDEMATSQAYLRMPSCHHHHLLGFLHL